jgi:uncharacterized DUF497 family protein
MSCDCEEAVRFEWDTEKEKANVTKHRVNFTEATAAFYHPKAVISADEEHSAMGGLFCIGRTERGILTVCFSYRGETFGSSVPVIGGKTEKP